MGQDTTAERMLQRQEGLRRVIESISSELDLRPLLTGIVELACDLLGAQRGCIGLVDDAGQLVRTEAIHNMAPDTIGQEFARGVGLAGLVMRSGQPVVLTRYADMERPVLDACADDAVVGVPIYHHRRLVGTLGLAADPGREFSPEDVALLTQLTRHAAVAINNARQLEIQTQRAARLETISRVARLISSSLSRDEILRIAVEEVRRLLDCRSAGLFLVCPTDPQMLVLLERRGWSTEVQVGEYRQSIREGIIGAAARQRESVLVDDVNKDDRYIIFPGADKHGTLAELAIPILNAGELKGVLNIESARPFDRDDISGLEIIADQLGVAIDNAALFADTRRALADMHLMYRTGERLSMARDVHDVVRQYLILVAAEQRVACDVFLDLDQGVLARRAGGWRPKRGLNMPFNEAPIDPGGVVGDLKAGTSVAITDIAEDERLGDDLRNCEDDAENTLPIRAAAMIPLTSQRRYAGFIMLTLRKPHLWCDADYKAFRLTAPILATAIDSRRRQREVSERNRQLAVAEERRVLARELHDSVNQLVFSMTLLAQSLSAAWRQNPDEGRKRTNRLVELAAAVSAEMRALLEELKPDPGTTTATASSVWQLRQHGLETAIRHHVARGTDEDPVVSLDFSQYQAQSAATERALLRIAQEALANAIKHSGAGAIQLVAAVSGPHAQISVQDDGSGFDPCNGEPGLSSPGCGLGVETMRERAMAANGQLEIFSGKGTGTRVVARVARVDRPI